MKSEPMVFYICQSALLEAGIAHADYAKELANAFKPTPVTVLPASTPSEGIYPNAIKTIANTSLIGNAELQPKIRMAWHNALLSRQQGSD
jgi:hypothetical protein